MHARRMKAWVGAMALMAAGTASAQTPLTFSIAGANLTLYGDVDLYAMYMKSSSGAKEFAIQDGGYLRTRLGIRGDKAVAPGYVMKFTLEQGLNDTSGAQADATRLFDRQAWAGVATPIGEFRVGRQNSVIFYKGSYIDNTTRTLGSVINAFGVPSRYDSDVSYATPRMAGFQAEAHYSFQGSTPGHTTNQAVYQWAVDYENGPFKVGYGDLTGKAPAGSVVSDDVYYRHAYFNWDYGQGKVYLAFVQSNNNSTTGSGSSLLFNGGSPLGNVGTLVSGTDVGAKTKYDIPQISADYQVTKALRLGALYGKIKDKSGGGKKASGWNIAAYYDIWKDTMLYGLVNQIDNDPNAGFRPSGSAGLTKPFTSPQDVNGQKISMVAVGFVYKF